MSEKKKKPEKKSVGIATMPMRPKKKKYPEKGSAAYRELCEAADRGWPTKIWSDN